MKEITLQDFLELLVKMDGTFILNNEIGSIEFRGDDLYLKPYREWITVYHSQVKNSESRSHLHLRWRTLRSATVVHEEGETPFLAFHVETRLS